MILPILSILLEFARSGFTKFAADLDGAFYYVHVFEYLEPEVAVEIWVVGEEFVDDVEGLLRLLPAEKCTEPSVWWSMWPSTPKI